MHSLALGAFRLSCFFPFGFGMVIESGLGWVGYGAEEGNLGRVWRCWPSSNLAHGISHGIGEIINWREGWGGMEWNGMEWVGDNAGCVMSVILL